MNALALKTIANYCHGQLINGSPNMMVDNVVIDSRKVIASSLFIAFSGEQVDGHDCIVGLSGKTSAALVERVNSLAVPQIKVTNTEKALGDLARHYRHQLTMPVIAMTGSCGKTSTKDMLLAILSRNGNVCATKGNQNNEIGVPLTILNINDADDYAIVEMGAAEKGDIDYLMSIVQPDVVALTNVSTAHIGRFGGEKGISQAKSEIYQSLKASGTALVNIDEKYSDDWLAILQANNARKIIYYSSENPLADIYAKDIQVNHQGVIFTASVFGESVPVRLNVLGRHHVSNALCAIAAAYSLAVNMSLIVEGLAAFKAIDGRMAEYRHFAGGVLIDDSYNANTGSVKAAIDVLSMYKKQRVLVFGDMAELGKYSEALHAEIGQYAKARGIETLLTIGVDSRYAGQAFSATTEHFDNKEMLSEYLHETLTANDTLLIKGSRSSELDCLVELLKKKDRH